MWAEGIIGLFLSQNKKKLRLLLEDDSTCSDIPNCWRRFLQDSPPLHVGNNVRSITLLSVWAPDEVTLNDPPNHVIYEHKIIIIYSEKF